MKQYNETEQKILKSALTLFSEHGYQKTTTKQIAANAGVNELTIFRKFTSKANLFQVVTEDYVERAYLESVLIEGLSGKDFEDIIHTITERTYRLYKDNIKLFKVQLIIPSLYNTD